MAKSKGGTGRGTDKKGWNRWQASANRLKNAPKPYKSKGTKKPQDADGAAPAATAASKSSRTGNGGGSSR
ncbi:DUF3934 domain-containing protein [Paenibacillus sacheonensis]|uniref:DUF3934 domain-containing protein n=1 Tax=Paenibacillus sacheonensis TaxID=742054 RepID=A0A7X4YTR3_9BACL|nr:DUF3934 domain-containing protein [Paenibacillus sacheonensis]MBM7568692.1 hypothetical protein [Paenibacillus sacheonensis]NBC72417.1 DUF3934 domain-containing protein [Paenibacillus sacheonensis]